MSKIRKHRKKEREMKGGRKMAGINIALDK